ncbi:hypothetical protein ACFL1I_04980 [Candidatus Omnitrophota bacterium]
MAKVHYSTDRFNRLLLTQDGRRYPLAGVFKVERNRLNFTPERKAPLSEQLNFNLPKKITFRGRWRLDPNHDLNLVLIQTRSQHRGDQLKFHGKITSVRAEQLTFQIHCKDAQDKDVVSLFRLGGRWQADQFNQLQFLVSRDLRSDVLRFKGAWQLNKTQQIIYRYSKYDLVRKTKIEEELIYQGHWQFDAKNRLTYILDLKSNSFFAFRVQLESPNIRSKRGEIRYRLGVGVRGLRKQRIISLFGRWKFTRRGEIDFVIDYGQKGIRKLTFQTKVAISKDNQIIFELLNKKAEGLGLRVIFTHDFLKGQAQVFSRLSRLKDHGRIEAGMKLRW